jgi:tetratricopeptide (TPR) repeat protein
MHLLVTNTEYYGKVRVLLSNLRSGSPLDVACRNSVGRTAAQIEQEAAQHLAAGNFAAVSVPGRAFAERDFPERELTANSARLAIADALVGAESRAAYDDLIRENVHIAEAQEGLGLLDLRSGQREQALQHFTAAVEMGTQSLRAYLEYGRLEKDDVKARQALEQALKLNPKLSEAHLVMAQRIPEPDKKIEHLKTATALDPRDAGAWQMLGETCLELKNFGCAARAWKAGEQAATSAEQRERMRQAWLSIEKQRLDYEEGERKRIAADKQREIEKLKEEARAEVRALEARVNRGKEASQPGEKVVPWWDGPKPEGRLQGLLKQIDCLGRQARLVVQSEDGKIVKLLIVDPSQITVIGGGESNLGCGRQKARRVSVEYFPKANAKLTTAGEVATLEFQ